MTSAHKLIAIILIWIVCGGIMTVMFMSGGINFLGGWLLLLLSLLIMAAAVAGTYVVARQVADIEGL
jgi:hypothetical protein